MASKGTMELARKVTDECVTIDRQLTSTRHLISIAEAIDQAIIDERERIVEMLRAWEFYCDGSCDEMGCRGHPFSAESEEHTELISAVRAGTGGKGE